MVYRNPYWWAAVVAFTLHQVVQWGFGWSTPFLDDYLDPLLCPIILLGLWLLERRIIFHVPRLTVLETGVATLLLAVLFEEVYPRFQEGFQRDVADYLFYALGGIYFYILVNRGGLPPPA